MKPKSQKSLKDIDNFVRSVSAKQGWGVQSDSEFLRSVQRGLQKNYNRYGYFLCPCRDGAGIRELDRDIICPCIYNLRDQSEYGHCYCALFFQKNRATDSYAPIPDRRPQEHYESS